MTDGNAYALAQREAECDAWEASQEPCLICDEVGCDCAQDMAEYDADNAINRQKEDGNE